MTSKGDDLHLRQDRPFREASVKSRPACLGYVLDADRRPVRQLHR